MIVLAHRVDRERRAIRPNGLVNIGLCLKSGLHRYLCRVHVWLHFRRGGLVFNAGGFFFMLFRFLYSVAFHVCRHLLTGPLFESLILVGVAGLSVVTRCVVVDRFRAQGAHFFTFPLLCLGRVIFSQVQGPTRFIRVHVRAIFGRSTLVCRREEVVVGFPNGPIAGEGAGVRPLTGAIRAYVVHFGADLFSQFSDLRDRFRLGRFAQ